MSRIAPFDKHVARGLLTVIGQAGQSMSEATESEEPEEVSQESREPRREAPRPDLSQSESSAEIADEPEGDLAARRLFAGMELAKQGEAVEPASVEPAAVEPAPEPPTVERPPEPPPAEPPPVPSQRSADTKAESPGVPEPNPWCLALAETDEPSRQLALWLEVQVASASPTRFEPGRSS